MAEFDPDKIDGTDPIYLYQEGVELPKDGEFYVIGSNGMFKRKESLLISAMVKVDKISILKPVETSIELRLPKLPIRILAQAHAFFLKVFKKYASESYVTLFYSPKKKKYQLYCPTQEVTAGSVDYERKDQPDFNQRRVDGWPWIAVGTIHSHCDFSAYHSGVDTGDEATWDGLHITIGHVNAQRVSLASSIAINAERLKLEPEACIEGLIKTELNVVKSKWLWQEDEDGRNSRYSFDLSEEDELGLSQDLKEIQEVWMPKVSKGRIFGKKYKNYGSSFYSQEYTGYGDYKRYEQNSDEVGLENLWKEKYDEGEFTD